MVGWSFLKNPKFWIGFTLNVFISFLVVTVVLFAKQMFDAKKTNQALQLQNHVFMQKALDTLSQGVDAFSYDALFMAGLAENEYSPIEQKFDLNNITNIMTQYGYATPLVDQVRLLSRKGMELVRINVDNENRVDIVPQDRLQNKSSRYYFTDTRELVSGAISISQLDLNVEQGRVEIPVKPMIRIATPLYDSADNFIGTVVINFRAAELLNRVRELPKSTLHDIWLINEKGFWVLAPPNQSPWADQLLLNGNSLQDYSQALFDRMMKGSESSGMFIKNAEYITFQRFDIKPQQLMQRPVISRAQNLSLIVSTQIHESGLLGIAAQTFANSVAFLFYVLGLMVAFIFSYQSYRKGLLARRNRFQKNLIETFFESSPEAMMLCNAGGELFYENFKMTELMAQMIGEGRGALGIETAEQRQELWRQYKQFGFDSDLIEIPYKDSKRYFRRQGSWVGDSEQEMLLGIVITELTDVKKAQAENGAP